MDAVNAFNQELFSLMDMKPPISRAKMISITKSAIKAIKLYKHVVQIVEKFIKKCKPEYKVPGLYVVDSIVRQSRHQFGADKDVFGPRFTKNITGTFENLCLCPTEDRSKIVRVLNLWQKNGVFKIEIIQPLLDMAAGTGSSASVPDVDHEGPDGGSPPTPVKVTSDPLPAVTANSIVAAVPQLQNSDAFAAVAQLFQSSQGQQLQQMLQTFQQPGKNQSPALDNSLMAQLQGAQLAPHIQNPLLAPIAAQPMEQKAAFDKKLLDRFDYDDEPDGVEDTKKEETTAVTAVVTAMTTTTVPTMPPFGFHENIQQAAYTQIRTQTSQMEHFQGPVLGMPQDPAHQQASLPPNGQLQNFGLMHPQAYPGMMPQMSHPLLPQQMPVGSGLPPGFPGVYAPQNEAYGQHMVHQMQDVSMDIDPPQMEGKHRPDGRRSRSHSGSRSPKRRRSRSNSRNRRSRHRRSRSRSRDRRRHSPRSRSQERRERERERERRLKGLPHTKNETLSVCSTTLWVGQLDKRTQQQDVACLLEEFGQIESINMIPPRGCAYIVMVHRQDAFRALQKLSRGSFKVNQKAIKIAWALNKGIKPEYKQYWDVELGVTYIPWSKVKLEDLDSFCQGGMLDGETLCPEWKGVQNDLEKPDEVSQNGRSEPPQADENPVAASVQGNTIPRVSDSCAVPPGAQPMGTVGGLQPPAFPTHMGLPPPAFPPGVPPPPPPPFMRPGFNPMQMPPGFLPPNAMPPMGSSGPPPPAVNMPSSTVPGSSDDPSNPSNDPGARNSGEAVHGSVPGLSQGGMPQQMAGMGNQVGAPPGGPPSGGLLGARPGMIPLQRPPGVPPPHMQRFPLHPPRPNMPPMPPQMMHRGPPQMMHREPPPGGFGMPPPHPIRGPFSPHGPPFLRPGGPRGPEGPDEREGRPFRNERPGFGRDRDQERFGGRRPPYTGGSEGRGGERPEGRERFGNRHEEFEQRGGWDRERRDWGRSPEPERAREPEERGRRTSGHRDREPGTRERSTRWDRDDRRDKADEADAADRYRDTDGTEPAADSVKELTQQEPVPQLPAQPSEVTAEPAGSEPSAGTKPADKAQETDS